MRVIRNSANVITEIYHDVSQAASTAFSADAKCSIEKCYSIGIVYGSDAGSIAGASAGIATKNQNYDYKNGECNIKNCVYNATSIVGSNVGNVIYTHNNILGSGIIDNKLPDEWDNRIWAKGIMAKYPILRSFQKHPWYFWSYRKYDDKAHFWRLPNYINVSDLLKKLTAFTNSFEKMNASSPDSNQYSFTINETNNIANQPDLTQVLTPEKIGPLALDYFKSNVMKYVPYVAFGAVSSVVAPFAYTFLKKKYETVKKV
jgi:hypothetical protein